jgi:predicted TIM-barrel fold metal-dependent hydrolase
MSPPIFRASTPRDKVIEVNLTLAEPIIEPDLPIVDAHHHLWFVPEAVAKAIEAQNSFITLALALTFRHHRRYLFDELIVDLTSGHNVRATVFCEAHAMYRSSGPEEMKSVGEVEFVNGVAAMAASGAFGEVKACAGIVGGVDLRLGDCVEEVLIAHLQAGGGRYRGVRTSVMYDEDPRIVGKNAPHILQEAKFRAGFARLSRLGLSFDALVLEPQLPDLVDLARAFPDTQIILNHVGAPVGEGRYAGQREARFPLWQKHVRDLATCENVAVKLGGVSIPFGGFKSLTAIPPFTSEQLSAEWNPYIDTCIDAFGAHRCMFESNFPVDSNTCTYPVLWNAFKRLAAGASAEEKTALFSGTAIRVYRLDI